MTQAALVIGGGIGGIQAATDLAVQGFPVTLVEKSNRLGGRLADPNLKLLYPNLRPAAEILAEKGLLGLSHGSKGSPQFYLRPEGIQYYRELKQEVQALEAVNKEVREFLSSEEFRKSFPVAFKKWADAGDRE